MDGLSNSVTPAPATLLLLVGIVAALYFPICSTAVNVTDQLERGFEVAAHPSAKSFQTLITDKSGNFSMGFLRVNQTELAVAVIHVASSEPLWLANPFNLAPWSDNTRLSFNGSLVLTGPSNNVLWMTESDGDRAILLNDSDLQIQHIFDIPTVEWRSFNCPSDTLVENQNFTTNMTLTSSNGLYTMQLGSNFMALYADFNTDFEQIYNKHRALEAREKIIPGAGPIHLRVVSDGYLGMFQNGSLPVDVQAFYSFQRPLNGILRLQLTPDGNLKGFYWDGSSWILDYQAISDECQLPNPCGSYGMCTPGRGCSCLDNVTIHQPTGCFATESGDFCSPVVDENNFRVIRISDVDLPFKELMSFKTGLNLSQCQSLCENNCTCWGSVYNNASGFCYFVDYPIHTVVGVVDDTKIGYFKMREPPQKSKSRVGFGVGMGILGAVIGIAAGVIGFFAYRIWWRDRMKKKGVTRFFEDDDGEILPGPYKEIGAASFNTIEMSQRP